MLSLLNFERLNKLNMKNLTLILNLNHEFNADMMLNISDVKAFTKHQIRMLQTVVIYLSC